MRQWLSHCFVRAPCLCATLKFLCCADDPEFKAEAEALDWEGMDFGDELEAQVGLWQATCAQM